MAEVAGGYEPQEDCEDDHNRGFGYVSKVCHGHSRGTGPHGLDLGLDPRGRRNDSHGPCLHLGRTSKMSIRCPYRHTVRIYHFDGLSLCSIPVALAFCARPDPGFVSQVQEGVRA